jgi:hypothetical protein
MKEQKFGKPIGIPDGLTFEERAKLIFSGLLKNLNEGSLAEEARRKAEKPESPEKEVAEK